MLEHKGLYWSKIKGTEEAKTVEPDADYIIPFGKGRMVQTADETSTTTISVIAYGMGVYWARNAAKNFPGKVEIIDLRTLVPLDTELIYASVKKHNRCLVITEEPANNSFAQSVAARIQQHCFEELDAPVMIIGAENTPAVPLNSTLEQTVLPNATKVAEAMEKLLSY
jgi:2-oxoisovalerate dehydrogenase E1 component